jgi:hypothetical protein
MTWWQAVLIAVVAVAGLWAFARWLIRRERNVYTREVEALARRRFRQQQKQDGP